MKFSRILPASWQHVCSVKWAMLRAFTPWRVAKSGATPLQPSPYYFKHLSVYHWGSTIFYDPCYSQNFKTALVPIFSGTT